MRRDLDLDQIKRQREGNNNRINNKLKPRCRQCLYDDSYCSRIHADSCDRLWVLDTGTIGIGNTTIQACPYTLNIFDLTSDKLLRQYRLRAEDINMARIVLIVTSDEENLIVTASPKPLNRTKGMRIATHLGSRVFQRHLPLSRVFTFFQTVSSYIISYIIYQKHENKFYAYSQLFE